MALRLLSFTSLTEKISVLRARDSDDAPRRGSERERDSRRSPGRGRAEDRTLHRRDPREGEQKQRDTRPVWGPPEDYREHPGEGARPVREQRHPSDPPRVRYEMCEKGSQLSKSLARTASGDSWGNLRDADSRRLSGDGQGHSEGRPPRGGGGMDRGQARPSDSGRGSGGGSKGADASYPEASWRGSRDRGADGRRRLPEPPAERADAAASEPAEELPLPPPPPNPPAAPSDSGEATSSPLAPKTQTALWPASDFGSDRSFSHAMEAGATSAAGGGAGHGSRTAPAHGPYAGSAGDRRTPAAAAAPARESAPRVAPDGRGPEALAAVRAALGRQPDPATRPQERHQLPLGSAGVPAAELLQAGSSQHGGPAQNLGQPATAGGQRGRAQHPAGRGWSKNRSQAELSVAACSTELAELSEKWKVEESRKPEAEVSSRTRLV